GHRARRREPGRRPDQPDGGLRPALARRPGRAGRTGVPIRLAGGAGWIARRPPAVAWAPAGIAAEGHGSGGRLAGPVVRRRPLDPGAALHAGEPRPLSRASSRIWLIMRLAARNAECGAANLMINTGY